MSTYVRVAALFLVLLPQACATAGTTATPSSPVTELAVENHQWDDLTVYLIRQGRYIRLGWVVAQTSAVLTIPEEHAHSLEDMTLVAAHPSDREAHAWSTPFQVHAGRRHRWTISPAPGPSQVVY